MELVLNVFWALLTALMFGLWVRFVPRTGSDKRNQCVALALLVLFLFPVISVTDDLQAALNPAETDCSLRRDHACAPSHSVTPAFAAPPPQIFAELSFGVLRVASPHASPWPAIELPALNPIENRPPPAA
jgi:hypothetical protein